MFIRHILAALLVLTAAPALPDTRALVFGNEDYDTAAPVPNAGSAMRAADALAGVGFRVIAGQDMRTNDMRRGLGQFIFDAWPPERLVILLNGHFAQGSGRTFFLGIEADSPSFATVDGTGLSVGVLLSVAADTPGGAVVLLGEADAETGALPLGSGLTPGIGELDIPQGVTVLRGAPGDIAAFAREALTVPDTSLPELLAGWPELSAEGFLSRLLPFLPAELVSEPVDPGAEERELWEAARTTDTIAAYESYLRRYPDGRFAAAARDAIARLEADPERVEAELNLTAAERREIQRQLTLLGFNTRGIDGIFGPGTRSAITNWQDGRGLPPTGFINSRQRELLSADAARRAAEIEREEEERRRAEEAADRAYWRDTGSGRDEAGLRAYLDRYPDGLYADVARSRLAEYEAERDRRAWDSARAADTIEAYRRYLNDFPRGDFSERARARMDELQRAERETRDRRAWDQARAADTAEAYRRYLNEFPDGLFADRARSRLNDLEDERERRAWDEARSRDTADAYRRYLDAYPRGAFADEARARLAEIREAEDRRAWDAARSENTVAAYRRYLDAFPDGAFAAQARERIAAMTDDDSEARAAEEALRLPQLARVAIESQLAAQGYDPGRVDGQFDENTRRAIRRYQRDRGMPVTGYVNERLISSLMTDGLPSLLQ